MNIIEAISEIHLTIEAIDPLILYGENNVKLGVLKKAFPELSILARGNQVKISGNKKDAQNAKAKLELMVRYVKDFHEISIQQVEELVSGGNPFENKIAQHEADNQVLVYGRDGRVIKPKTINQKKLVESSMRNDIVFALGPAGTGKTYTAVALAVRALKNKLVKKIILTRPAVEAGENLGFLPGDMKEKVDPYLRPLYDALDDMIPMEKLNFFMTNRVIEVAPLAFMRGRTLDNAFIILDEAQNTTPSQLKMFLTRLGPSAKCIVTGDMTQIDLPPRQVSGLKKALHLLSPIDGIGVVHLTAEDVVRHRLVKEIIKAYQIADQKERARIENQISSQNGHENGINHEEE